MLKRVVVMRYVCLVLVVRDALFKLLSDIVFVAHNLTHKFCCMPIKEEMAV